MKRFLIVALLAFATQAHAVDISLSPVTVVAPDTATAVTLTLVNKDKEPMTYQVTVEAWSQVGEKRTTAPTRELMASPSIVEVKPNSKRVIRLVRPNPASPTRNFRVSLRELPTAIAAKNGVRMALNHSIPVVFESASAPAAVLKIKRVAKGLLVTNTGGKVARITTIGPESGDPWKSGALGWLLPGGAHVYPFPQAGKSVAITINGTRSILAVE